jgi:hypothetical protein
MEKPVNLTKKEKDILLDMLLKEVSNVDNLNGTMQNYLSQYRSEVLEIYKKVCDSLPND